MKLFSWFRLLLCLMLSGAFGCVYALNATISGSVRTSTGGPVQFVTVAGIVLSADFDTLETETNLAGNYTLTFNLPTLTTAEVLVLARGGVTSFYGYQLFDSSYILFEAQPLILYDGTNLTDVNLQLTTGAMIGGTGDNFTSEIIPIAEVSGKWADLWSNPLLILQYRPISLFLPWSYDPFNRSINFHALNLNSLYDVAAVAMTDIPTQGYFSMSLRDYTMGVVAPGSMGSLVNPGLKGAIYGRLYALDPDTVWFFQNNVAVALQREINPIAHGLGLTVEGEFLIPNLIISDEYSLHATFYEGPTQWWGELYGLHILPGDTLSVIVHMVPLPAGVSPNPPMNPQSLQLIYGFPNPFNAQFTFTVTLLQKQLSPELVIYDLNGRQVQSWNWPELNAGIHRIDWRPAGHPSGLYLYRFISSEFTTSGKCLYLK